MTPRVLHVIESLDRGAVENWLLRMLRHARKKRVPADWEFYCTLGRAGTLEPEAAALGARVVAAPVPFAQKMAFSRSLRSHLRAGAYDVLHCHHDLASAFYLTAAAGIRLKRRIVHAHNADLNLPTSNTLKLAVFRPLCRRVCLSLADRIVGISSHVLDAFLEGGPRRSGRDLVHYYGVEEQPGPSPEERAAVRRELDLEPEAPVLLFGGRIVPEKNPVFAVDVFAEVLQLNREAMLVFAGAGCDEPRVAERAARLGVSSRVRMAGWRSDLGRLMRACDIFILPRLEKPMEGFGLAVVEAQLAGMRLLLSNGIADDPLLRGVVMRRAPLSSGPGEWARAALSLLSENPSAEAAAAALRESPMDMDRSLADLIRLYE